jgi:hypothetical protein
MRIIDYIWLSCHRIYVHERDGNDVMAKNWEIIMDACLALSDEGIDECRRIIQMNYPFDPNAKPREVKSRESQLRDSKVEVISCWVENHIAKMRVFSRDGFENRFTGEPLIFPAVLRLLSKALPREFPFQQYWRPEATHIAYYDLGACTNLLIPLSRGGKNEEENLITTTMPYILARTDQTVEEAGWRLTREGFVDEWDGMSTWYVEYITEHQELREINFFNLWFNAARSVLRL